MLGDSLWKLFFPFGVLLSREFSTKEEFSALEEGGLFEEESTKSLQKKKGRILSLGYSPPPFRRNLGGDF